MRLIVFAVALAVLAPASQPQPDIDRQAADSRHTVHFVVIKNVTFYDGKAWLEIRGDSQPPTPTFCAYHYRLYYRRDNGRWTFDHLEASFCQ